MSKKEEERGKKRADHCSPYLYLSRNQACLPPLPASLAQISTIISPRVLLNAFFIIYILSVDYCRWCQFELYINSKTFEMSYNVCNT